MVLLHPPKHWINKTSKSEQKAFLSRTVLYAVVQDQHGLSFPYEMTPFQAKKRQQWRTKNKRICFISSLRSPNDGECITVLT